MGEGGVRCGGGTTAPIAAANDRHTSAPSIADVKRPVRSQGDPFGIPAVGDGTRVVVLKGETHSLSRNPAAVSEAVAAWLSEVLQMVR